MERTQKEWWGVGRIVPKNRATGWGITTKLCKTGGPQPEVQILETHGLPEKKVILRGRVRSVVAVLEVQVSGGNEMFFVGGEEGKLLGRVQEPAISGRLRIEPRLGQVS